VRCGDPALAILHAPDVCLHRYCCEPAEHKADRCVVAAGNISEEHAGNAVVCERAQIMQGVECTLVVAAIYENAHRFVCSCKLIGKYLGFRESADRVSVNL